MWRSGIGEEKLMRFSIAIGWNGELQFRVGDCEIEVRRGPRAGDLWDRRREIWKEWASSPFEIPSGLNYRVLNWAWTDGRRYRVRSPEPRRGRPMIWMIEMDGDCVCTGHLVESFWRPLTRSYLEWKCHPELFPRAIRVSSSCCRGCVVDENGYRLAAWRNRARGMDAVVRPSVTGDLLGIVAATIVCLSG